VTISSSVSGCCGGAANRQTTRGDADLQDTDLRDAVRSHYALAARSSLQLLDDATDTGGSCCGGGASGLGCDPISSNLYDDEAALTSQGALAASLGCGNPTLLAELHPGEDVLDLGSGGGLDVLLSARRVAPGGTAYGVDMTPEMLELARRNQAEAQVPNAEFLLGSIEDLPMADASVDVVISNCVINLSTDKDAVLREAFRVLRPGGRFAVADIVLLRELPAPVLSLVRLWTGCIAGALLDTDYLARLSDAGFDDAQVEITRTYSRADLEDLAASLRPSDLPAGLDIATTVALVEGAFASAFVRALKPA
jgi:SAM-dependent methyltransferase